MEEFVFAMNARVHIHKQGTCCWRVIRRKYMESFVDWTHTAMVSDRSYGLVEYDQSRFEYDELPRPIHWVLEKDLFFCPCVHISPSTEKKE